MSQSPLQGPFDPHSPEDDTFSYPTALEADHGDYSARMGALFDDGDVDVDGSGQDSETEEMFVYTGIDAADVEKGYKDRLRDVLGSELTDDDEHTTREGDSFMSSLPGVLLSRDHQAPISPPLASRRLSPAPNETLRTSRPYLHPSVSRLRSYTPQPSHTSSQGMGSLNTDVYDRASPSPSHFSATSWTSSNVHARAPGFQREDLVQEAFAWTELRVITEEMYNQASQKLSSVLGAPLLGAPTVMTAKGVICIGTDQGKICVYDFQQTLKCICGTETPVKGIGAVTALAVSYDHTYLASGHATGYLQLFELKSPNKPSRLVPPTTWSVVASGRKEGHIEGSRIISVGFLSGRHTAIVSADDRGLAFSHSLGKILFVEAPDILRILGKYREERPLLPIGLTPPLPPTSVNGHSSVDTSFLHRGKMGHSILDAIPLPLGTSPHATDAYSIVALLTPTKLVIVGMRPTPKTWFKCMRGSRTAQTRGKGSMAWYPSVLPSTTSTSDPNQVIATSPLLVYTWGTELHVIRVNESRTKESVKNLRTGQTSEVQVNRVVYDGVLDWLAEGDILVVQWLNSQQILILTATLVQVFDANSHTVVERVPFDAFSLVSPALHSTIIPYVDSIGEIGHSLRVYKGKVFLLGRNNVRVGTLLTWADRILSFVEDGDFLSAIELARAYYVGEAPGNRNGLPDDPEQCKNVIGERMHALMVASARYAFSGERMTDGTHVTPDGRGVDRTELFESLVVTCTRACIAQGELEFLFEELFQHYDDAGIANIYLRQIESFILADQVRHVPPRITQRLITLHVEEGNPTLAERIIWHIHPACLDINQAIHLCLDYSLYDALIYVYTRALQDWVAPIVELLAVINRICHHRESKVHSFRTLGTTHSQDTAMEASILNAYRIYPFLANVLSGLSYPGGEPLSDDEACQAKKSVYAFLFSGTSCVWPPGENAKLVLTSLEDGIAEPTYPYVRSLLSFDSESFLHALDIAFEDPYLNEETNGTSRLIIVKILLEILSSDGQTASDAAFVNIFIARNVPKYPQFLQVSPNTLHGILIQLAEDPDLSTREDRQLAAEYLLSVYTPHDSEHVIPILHSAGFYRILRSWHCHEGRWGSLASIDLEDLSLPPSELFDNLDNVFILAARDNKGTLPNELVQIVSGSLPRLLDASLTRTAALLQQHIPDLHEEALSTFESGDDMSRFLYLQHLLGSVDNDGIDEDRSSLPSLSIVTKIAEPLRKLYMSLQCRFHPQWVIADLQRLPVEFLEFHEVLKICESHRVYHAAIWATNRHGDPRTALSKVAEYQKRLVREILGAFDSSLGHSDVLRNLDSLDQIVRIGVAICLEHSTSQAKIHLEDSWFQLLSSQINSVQLLSSHSRPDSMNLTASDGVSQAESLFDNTLVTLRALVQSTFTSLVSVTSTRTASFPRLFSRLINSASTSGNKQYTEFRMILIGMLESYRTEGDMLLITKHLLDRDLFQSVAEVSRQRERGWSPSRPLCIRCGQAFTGSTFTREARKIIVSRTGAMYHNACSP